MLHGIGVESPTQIALFVASTSVAGAGVGLLLLAGWIVGLILANAALALLAGFGLLHAERNFGIYATLAVVVGVVSIVMGTIFALDLDALHAINL
jgi:high-affinity nickel-transport protein